MNENSGNVPGVANDTIPSERIFAKDTPSALTQANIPILPA